jgi:hypothetical protein
MWSPIRVNLIDFLNAWQAEDEAALADEAAAWYNAPLPRRWHRCYVAQSGRIGTGALYERCACGGIRRNGGPWMERNSRRRGRQRATDS